MEDIERCRIDVDDLIAKGFDSGKLKNQLRELNYSQDTINTVLKERSTAVREKNTSNTASTQSSDITGKVAGFIIRHYMLSFMMLLILCIIVIVSIYPEWLPTIITYTILKLPKLIIFALVTKIFLLMGSSEEDNSWDKAILLGFIFCMIPVHIPLASSFWWMSVPLIAFIILPMHVMYNIDVKHAVVIVGLSTLIAIFYDMTLASLIAQYAVV